jgi:hypothetical protein
MLNVAGSDGLTGVPGERDFHAAGLWDCADLAAWNDSVAGKVG